jgi:uncharacterized protein YecT (DUF1311 family)
MNHKKTIIVALLLSLSFNHAFAEEAVTCLEKAMTQTEINKCSNINFQIADKELNRVYSTIQSRYVQDKLFLKKLKTAQLAWIQLRDADFEMQFPHQKEEGYYGSIFPTCASSYKTELTLQRVAFLKAWLIGVEEGDSCAGSKQFSQEDTQEQPPLTQCYQQFIGNTKESGTIELFLTVNEESDTVVGEYNYLPYEKDRRYGTIKGLIKKNTINAQYTFEQEGEKDTVDLQIELKNKVAVIKGNKKDEGLGLDAKLQKIDCER